MQLTPETVCFAVFLTLVVLFNRKKVAEKSTPPELRMGWEEIWEHTETLDSIYDVVEELRLEYFELEFDEEDYSRSGWFVDQRIRMFDLTPPDFITAIDAELKLLNEECRKKIARRCRRDEEELRDALESIAAKSSGMFANRVSAHNEYLRREELRCKLQALQSQLVYVRG